MTSIQLEKGKIIGLYGANGIGKTTLLKKLRNESPNEIAILMQSPLKTLPHLTPRLILNTLRENFSLKIEEKLLNDFKFFEQFKMSKYLDTPVGQLSGGENQALKIYTTLMIKADQYFLDEPTSFLDVEKKQILAQLIGFLQKQGKAFLIVEHDLNYLQQLTSELIHLQ